MNRQIPTLSLCSKQRRKDKTQKSPAEAFLAKLEALEGKILYPKWMKAQQKKAKETTRGSRIKSPGARPPTGAWDSYYTCAPLGQMKEQDIQKALRYFESDCLLPGQKPAVSCPNPIELDPRYYDQEWNFRINPVGSLSPPVKLAIVEAVSAVGVVKSKINGPRPER
jgi:hypothetical protein